MPRYRLIVTVPEDPDDPGYAIRLLRAFLKSALRTWGIRCDLVEPAE